MAQPTDATDAENDGEDALTPEDVIGDTVEQPLLREKQYAVTIPSRIAGALGLEDNEPMAFRPRLEGGAIVFDVERGGDPDAGNVRRLKRPRGYGATLRLPHLLAEERGLGRLLDQRDEVLVEIEVRDAATLTLRPWPETRPWTPAGGFDEEALQDSARKRKRLVTNRNGDGMHWKQYRLYYPTAHVERYGLTAGDHVQFRLTARDGELGVAVLMPTPDYEFDEDAPYTRSVVGNDDVGPGGERGEDATYWQYHSVVPKELADGLDFRGHSLVLDGGRGYLFVHRS